MTASLAQLSDNSNFLTGPLQFTTGPSHQANAQRTAVKKSATTAKSTSRVVTLPVPSVSVSRHIDWYAKKRRLPTLIADFIDIHWRSYLLGCFLKGGEENESFRNAVSAMKDLAWSVRPKKDSLSRRRLVALIPQLYQQLHTGLESVGLGSGTSEHDTFFAELAKLHQAALNP
jgi:hypothetical protein